jgi:hypothetical protein
MYTPALAGFHRHYSMTGFFSILIISKLWRGLETGHSFWKTRYRKRDYEPAQWLTANR